MSITREEFAKALKKVGSSIEELELNAHVVGFCLDSCYARIDSCSEILHCSVCWGATLEGHNYWSHIYRKLVKLETKPQWIPAKSRLHLLRSFAEGKRVKFRLTEDDCYFYIDRKGLLRFNRRGDRELASHPLDFYLGIYKDGAVILDKP